MEATGVQSGPAQANIDLPAAGGLARQPPEDLERSGRRDLGRRRTRLTGSFDSLLQLASRSVRQRPASQPQGGLAQRRHINNNSSSNNNNNQESALASNQFSTCSIGENVDDDGGGGGGGGAHYCPISGDRHRQSLSSSTFSSASPSSASSLLSHIEPAARSGGRRRRRRRASASSVTLAATNNGLEDDCAADRCCWLSTTSGCWCSMLAANASSGSLIGVANANLPANAQPDAAAVASARSSPLCERNKYYTNHYNTNKTALFSCQDAPRSSGGATSTGCCESRERELDNSGTTVEPTTTTSESRSTTFSQPDRLDNSSATKTTKLDQLINKLVVVDGYDRPSSISGSLLATSPSCQPHSAVSALRRSQSCRRDIIYNCKLNCHFHANRRKSEGHLGEEAELDKRSNKIYEHNTRDSASSSSLALDHLLSSDDQQGGISEQSDQASNVTTKPPTSANNKISSNNNNNNNCSQIHPLSSAHEGPRKEAARAKQQTHSGNAHSTSFGEVMAILQQLTIQDRLEAPKTYPNNTLIVDLNKCHNNVTNLWPQTTTATRSAIKLSHLTSFWSLLFGQKAASNEYERNDLQRPSKTAKKSRYKFPMPDPIAKTNVKLRPDDYNTALDVLTSDVRFKLHLLLYRRVQTIWMLLSTLLCILVPVVLTNLESLIIAAACFVWLALQLLGAFAGARFRNKLDQMLEKSVAQVNSFFLDHNLMLGVINVGSLITKTKLVIPMLYFDTSQCREHIESIISTDSRKDAYGKSKLTLDYSKIDLPPARPNSMALAQSVSTAGSFLSTSSYHPRQPANLTDASDEIKPIQQQLAKKIVLRYSQRWISYFDKRKLTFNDDRVGPRHLSTGKCLCQFVEEHFKNNSNQEQSVHYSKNNEQSPPATVRNNYLTNGNEATLVFGRPKAYNQETLIRPQVIHNQQVTAVRVVPTLSRLVSLNESPPEHLKINMESADQRFPSPLHQTTDSSVINLWNLQQFNDKQYPAKLYVPPLGYSVTNQTPLSSPDVSLEMNSDSIGRSDDLVRKLRLLLELRKNELQGLDGSLFSNILNKTPQTFVPFEDIGNKHPVANDVSTSTNNSVASSKDGNLVKVDDGKKFFSQREGLFFFNTNGAKKSQHHNGTNRNHVLEIC